MYANQLTIASILIIFSFQVTSTFAGPAGIRPIREVQHIENPAEFPDSGVARTVDAGIATREAKLEQVIGSETVRRMRTNYRRLARTVPIDLKAIRRFMDDTIGQNTNLEARIQTTEALHEYLSDYDSSLNNEIVLSLKNELAILKAASSSKVHSKSDPKALELLFKTFPNLGPPSTRPDSASRKNE